MNAEKYDSDEMFQIDIRRLLPRGSRRLIEMRPPSPGEVGDHAIRHTSLPGGPPTGQRAGADSMVNDISILLHQ